MGLSPGAAVVSAAFSVGDSAAGGVVMAASSSALLMAALTASAVGVSPMLATTTDGLAITTEAAVAASARGSVSIERGVFLNRERSKCAASFAVEAGMSESQNP